MSDAFDRAVRRAGEWLASERFRGISRLHSARDVAEQQGTIPCDYTVARRAAEEFHERLRTLFAERLCITTFGPYSPGQAVVMKRLGIEAIYLGGWATSAKGSASEDPGPDLASYPLSQVPEEAAALVRALLVADRNQHFARSRFGAANESARPVDYRPFIIADADTGHGGDAHVRNLIRRFVEAGVPGYHIDDQKPGVKKCGHQGGKVLVPEDEYIRRLNAARFQLDVMGVPGIIVARTDAEAAAFIDGSGDERDQPFLLGATNVEIPSFKLCYLAILKTLHDLGADGVLGHALFAVSEGEYRGAKEWLEARGLAAACAREAGKIRASDGRGLDAALDEIAGLFAERWLADAGIKTYGDAVADVMEVRAAEGDRFEMSVQEWRAFASRSSLAAAREKARSLGVSAVWDSELARTPEGYYQVRSGIGYAIARALGAAPFADILWMETATANLDEARHFAEAIHAVHPDKLLAYNLSPSFNWDTTGMGEEEMRRFPEELGRLGYVFNFITYGGHQIDGLAAEEFAAALVEDGMLALARLQRKLRLLESPYRTPQTLVGGPRLDGALMASTGRTATTRAMGKGSTQFQHLVQTEVPPKLLEEWLALWSAHHGVARTLRVELRPHTQGSDLLELRVTDGDGEKLADVVFTNIKDRRGRVILSVRDQNTFEPALRRKRLMTLVHLFLIHRYKAFSVHYVDPTDDNHYQAGKMQKHGIYSDVRSEVGHIIVAQVNRDRIAELLQNGRRSLAALIERVEPMQEAAQAPRGVPSSAEGA